MEENFPDIIKRHPHANDTSPCPKCGHPMWEHYEESVNHPYQCWERMSYDNNDFCGCAHGAPAVPVLVLYAVRNSQGLWYKPKGLSYKNQWVEDINKAKIFPTLSRARTARTAFASNPDYPPPDIVEFTVSNTKVLDDSAHLKKAMRAKQRKQERRNESSKRWRREAAERRLREAQEELEKLNRSR